MLQLLNPIILLNHDIKRNLIHLSISDNNQNQFANARENNLKSLYINQPTNLLEFGGQTRQGQLTGQLASFKREPLIGLEFLVEVTSPNVRSESKFICLLCDKDNYSSPDQVIQDVLGSEHRLKYLVSLAFVLHV